jgi:hypothetical protein
MLCCLLCFCAGAVLQAAAQDEGSHLIVIGVDGLYPRGIEMAKTPNIHAMIRGKYSLALWGLAHLHIAWGGCFAASLNMKPYVERSGSLDVEESS